MAKQHRQPARSESLGWHLSYLKHHLKSSDRLAFSEEFCRLKRLLYVIWSFRRIKDMPKRRWNKHKEESCLFSSPLLTDLQCLPILPLTHFTSMLLSALIDQLILLCYCCLDPSINMQRCTQNPLPLHLHPLFFIEKHILKPPICFLQWVLSNSPHCLLGLPIPNLLRLWYTLLWDSILCCCY